jgi:hypothetical protein
MSSRRENYYEVLGIRVDASEREIHRAWRKLKAELEDDRTVPDRRRQILALEAYETLADAKRRSEYDASIRAPTLLGISGGRNPRKRWTVAIGGLFVVLGLAYYYVVARQEEMSNTLYPATEGALEVHTKASVAIGRVSRIEMSGNSTPLGLAVAVQEGVMMTPCKGLGPGAQIVVNIPPRTAPGQMLKADEALGLCMLRMHAGGSWPVTLTSQEPRPGDRIYSVQLNPQGEVALRELKVTRLAPKPAGKEVEVAKQLTKVLDGAPLLDVHGRVFAVAIEGGYRMLPAAWVEQTQPDPVRAKPAPKAREEDEPEAKPAPGMRRPMRPEDIPPERRERIEKAFRPPPSVPDDL